MTEAEWREAPDPKPSYREFFGLGEEPPRPSLISVQWQENKVGLALAGAFVIAVIAAVWV